MRVNQWLVVAAAVMSASSGAALLRAAQQGQGQAPSSLPLSHSVRERGSSVTGAFEGWYFNKDGSVSLLVGYFNRNTKQELDIPVGPNNRIEPGDPDQGQPTHFLTGRQWGVFSIKVPRDFGTKKLTWTLTTNGQTNTITLHTAKDWIVEPFEDPASKNRPPVVRFEPNGPPISGPPAGLAASFTTTWGTPLPLTAWVTDLGPQINAPEPSGRGRGGAGAGGAFLPPPALSVGWSVMRGPAGVKFDPIKPAIDKERSGKATTVATFAAPGDYLLRLQANDHTGEGGSGFQCCWTNALVSVTVRPVSTDR